MKSTILIAVLGIAGFFGVQAYQIHEHNTEITARAIAAVQHSGDCKRATDTYETMLGIARAKHVNPDSVPELVTLKTNRETACR